MAENSCHLNGMPQGLVLGPLAHGNTEDDQEQGFHWYYHIQQEEGEPVIVW